LNTELKITDLCQYGSSSKKLDRKATLTILKIKENMVYTTMWGYVVV
jgi:hypothetical protein